MTTDMWGGGIFNVSNIRCRLGSIIVAVASADTFFQSEGIMVVQRLANRISPCIGLLLITVIK